MHHFIVLTNRRLKPEQLLNINQVFNDENTIKIEYIRKWHQALLDVPPARQRAALVREFGMPGSER